MHYNGDMGSNNVGNRYWRNIVGVLNIENEDVVFCSAYIVILTVDVV